MTRQEFQKLCATTVLLDGATGSNLMAAGMPRGVCPELWILEHPDAIHQLQTAYVEAGSQIIYAPTFGGNRINLARYGLEERIRELDLTLMGYAKKAAHGRALVAGDVTTTGQFMEPLGNLTYETAFDTYREQISLLAEGGADLLAVETMIHIGETCAAVDAAHAVCDLPVMCSMTVEADGNIFTGGNIIEAAAQLEAAGADAVGINCSVGPEQMEAIIHNIRKTVSIPVLAKPNAGMPIIAEDGQAVYQMEPEDFARHMMALASQGATLLGGCCGTTPAFIKALAQRLSARG
ncbi:MAG: homocysteine S-methyltransferase family protein [Lachnospiraceae bacterium]|jgi:5-methyltetrahydrofolate--homocysteine methyltransferase|nr:homocysteine S-methyltransferase family protein [Lachnospiraceae bacterium]